MASYNGRSEQAGASRRFSIVTSGDGVRILVRTVAPTLAGITLLAWILHSLAVGSLARSALGRGNNLDPMLRRRGRVSTSTLTYTTYLPLIQQNHCSACSDVVSPFSIQIAALHQIGATSSDLLEALEESGAGWARVRIDWSIIQPEPPPANYVWGPYHDEKLRLVAETGVRLIATVGDAPDWAADERCAPIYPDRLDEFAQFLTDLVHRYQEPPYSIKHWELINEPDGTGSGLGDTGLGCWADATTHQDGVRYAQMLAVASDAIRAADPEARVMMGGMAYDWFTEYGGPFDRYFPDDVVKAGGAEHVDVLNLHYFPDWHREWERWDPRICDRRLGWLAAPTCGDVFDGQGEAFEAVGLDLGIKSSYFGNRMRTCFGVEKPLWVTELAEHGYPDDPMSLTTQARYVIQGSTRGLAAGVENITWYALTAPNDSFEQDLLFDNWTPKPAYYAYQTMATELDGCVYSYDRSLWASEGCSAPDPPRGYRAVREAYVFRTPCGQEKTVAWSNEEEGAPLPFAPADELRVVDRQGAVRFVADGGPGDADGLQDGTVALILSPEPLFVTVR